MTYVDNLSMLPRQILSRGFCFAGGSDGRIDFGAVAGDHIVQLRLQFSQNVRWIDSGKIPVHVLVNDFDERKELHQ